MRVFLTSLGCSCKTRPPVGWVPREVPPTIKLGLIGRVKSGILLERRSFFSCRIKVERESEKGEGEDPSGMGFVRWSDLYALEVVSPWLAHVTNSRARSSAVSSSLVRYPLDECRDCKPRSEAEISFVDS
ncbi:hypothetical protein BHE74_00036067 [Ensete ventricosum]|nr:hypothetical protein BHE74_00036067 [Ensete ventricosum]RZS12729.1 hypothetical protein BHM03_00044220 [Ensete ventricosum]